MKYVAVLPFVHQPYADECLATCQFDSLLVVDNTKINLGVMRSHNLGVAMTQKLDADWLIVVSAAIRFGKRGGLDLIEALEHSDEQVVEAAGVYGWHLIAFSRECLDRVGMWDENFTPYGFDDLDYAWRIRQAFSIDYDPARGLWTKVPVDATDVGMGHSIKLAGVDAPAAPRLAYLCAKWGITIAEDGAKSQPSLVTPFGEDRPLSWWPTPPDSRSLLPADWEPVT